ncbi:GNAT family N-acetyltransferase [Jonesia quinghaiensis]|uniref:GNAT family N-acetyltransferase n=1 Tax=Jonesia quinghaiensis TaxID=262806 RepID=UPI00041D7E80|nr:GNAT family protein [Jonesia quinghaiensis]
MIGPRLTGELVALRPVETRDAGPLAIAVADAETRRLTGTVATFTEEGILQWIESTTEAPDRVDFAMTSLMPLSDGSVSDQCIGEIVINEIDHHVRSANLRLQSLPQYRGRGYGREAISLVMGYAFAPAPQGLGLHRLSLEVLDINPRARMLYESLGFTQEGVLREAARDGDGWCDVIVMSVLEDDFTE